MIITINKNGRANPHIHVMNRQDIKSSRNKIYQDNNDDSNDGDENNGSDNSDKSNKNDGQGHFVNCRQL